MSGLKWRLCRIGGQLSVCLIVGITDLMDMSLGELWEAWRAAIYGVARSQTRLSN